MSLVLFGWQMGSDSAVEFAQANLLHLGVRYQLLGSMAAGAMLVGLAASVYIATTGPRGVLIVQRLSRLVAPLVILAVTPPLVFRGTWSPLPTALAIGAFTLLLERLLRISLRELCTVSEASRGSVASPELRRRSRLAGLVVVSSAAFYAIYMSRYTLFNHRRFGTYGFDLGQFDHVFWSTLHGHPFRDAPLGLTHDWQELGNHAELSVIFFLPFYAIRPNAETLLIIQACMLGLGAIPLYLFAARRLPRVYACTLTICYLLYPPLHGSNFYDFHFQPIAATFVLFTIYFVDTRRWIAAAITFMIAVGCREDISVGLALLGLYLVFVGYRARAGLVMAISGAAYFVVIRFYVMPRFGQNWFSDMYKDLYPRPDGPHSYAGVMLTLASNPSYVFQTLLTSDKLRYFLQITAPIAFLPLRRGYLLPALVPGAMFTLLTTAYEPTTDIGFQYSGHFTPYVFAASAVMLSVYRSHPDSAFKLRAALAALVVATLLCTLHWGAFPPRGAIKGGFANIVFDRPTPEQEQKARDLAQLAAMIPPDASVSVSEEELPHVSARLNILTLKSGTNSADYLLYGQSSNGSGHAAKALQDGEYFEIATRPGLALLK